LILGQDEAPLLDVGRQTRSEILEVLHDLLPRSAWRDQEADTALSQPFEEKWSEERYAPGIAPIDAAWVASVRRGADFFDNTRRTRGTLGDRRDENAVRDAGPHAGTTAYRHSSIGGAMFH